MKTGSTTRQSLHKLCTAGVSNVLLAFLFRLRRRGLGCGGQLKIACKRQMSLAGKYRTVYFGSGEKLKLINYIKSFAFHAKVFSFLLFDPDALQGFFYFVQSFAFLLHKTEVLVVTSSFPLEKFHLLLQQPRAAFTLQRLFLYQVFLIQSTSPSAIQCMRKLLWLFHFSLLLFHSCQHKKHNSSANTLTELLTKFPLTQFSSARSFSTRSRQPCLFFSLLLFHPRRHYSIFCSPPFSLRSESLPLYGNHFVNFFIRLDSHRPSPLFSTPTTPAKISELRPFGRQRWNEKSPSYLRSGELLHSDQQINIQRINPNSCNHSKLAAQFPRIFFSHNSTEIFLFASNVKIFSLLLLG